MCRWAEQKCTSDMSKIALPRWSCQEKPKLIYLFSLIALLTSNLLQQNLSMEVVVYFGSVSSLLIFLPSVKFNKSQKSSLLYFLFRFLALL